MAHDTVLPSDFDADDFGCKADKIAINWANMDCAAVLACLDTDNSGQIDDAFLPASSTDSGAIAFDTGTSVLTHTTSNGTVQTADLSPLLGADCAALLACLDTDSDGFMDALDVIADPCVSVAVTGFDSAAEIHTAYTASPDCAAPGTATAVQCIFDSTGTTLLEGPVNIALPSSREVNMSTVPFVTGQAYLVKTTVTDGCGTYNHCQLISVGAADTNIRIVSNVADATNALFTFEFTQEDAACAPVTVSEYTIYAADCTTVLQATQAVNINSTDAVDLTPLINGGDLQNATTTDLTFCVEYTVTDGCGTYTTQEVVVANATLPVTVPYTGVNAFITKPAWATGIQNVELWGAGGGGSGAAGFSGFGGGGAYLTETTCTPVASATLTVIVGEGGIHDSDAPTFGGGGPGGVGAAGGAGASGGGATTLLDGTNNLFIAGGGGGSGAGANAVVFRGGDAGGLVGEDGTSELVTTATGGSGGTQTAGGAAGTVPFGLATQLPTAGGLATGGQGGWTVTAPPNAVVTVGAGGGGGGFYGGGGGAAGQLNGASHEGGGGGGSSLNGTQTPAIDGVPAGMTSDQYVAGVAAGGGEGTDGGPGHAVFEWCVV